LHIETKEALKRYNISRATLDSKRDIIVENNGIITGETKQSRNIYKTSVLDKLALEGKLGTKAKIAVLNNL